MNFKIRSVNGSFIVRSESGNIIEAVFCQNYFNEYKDIIRFDVTEYRAFYGSLPSGEIHIFDIGYWLRDARYFKACHDWRIMQAE